MNKPLKTTLNDFKLIFRTASLRVFLFLPLAILLVINWFLPYLVGQYPVVMDYVIFILMVSTTETAVMFMFIYAMVLIDEKETRVAKVYGILPLKQTLFILQRFILPFLIATSFTFLVLMVQPFFDFSAGPALAVSALAGLHSPLYGLAVTISSKNKMVGLVYMKIYNLFIIIPLVSFFLSKTIQPFFGIIPSYWIFLGMENMHLGEPILWPMVIGFIYSLFLIFILARIFVRRHFF